MNMSPQQAQRLVLISVFGLLVIAAYRGNLSNENESLWKRLWGTGVLAIMLGLVADVAPTIAGPFAVLILAGSVTNGGDKALHNFLGKLGGGSSASTGPAGPHGPNLGPQGGTRPNNKGPAGPQGPNLGNQGGTK